MYEFIPVIMREAASIMLSAHDTHFSMISKEGQANFVTRYDVAVEDFLTEKIIEKLPDAVVIGEESDDNHTELISTRLCIIMDPIDGTTNFIHDYRYSAISVGICDRGQMVYGAVLDPYADRLYHAERGGGAYVLDYRTGKEKKLQVSDRALCDSLVGFGTSPYRRDELGKVTFETAYQLFMTCRDVRRSGSAALDLCNIATGALDVFFEYSLLPWDYAAASIIIKEAGGIISCFDGSDIKFEGTLSVIAGNKLAHRQLIESKILK
ncbi:MAG: inositol monophosphatase [Ruminococcaceae bacterium]|nr:inositol monophosphatase [Oscillospiraceae bacterium]